MKIGILSDTHIHKGQSLPGYVWNALEDVDTIIHAGDLVSEYLLDELETMAPVIAVGGNCDWAIHSLPDKRIVQYGNIKIGITHGYLGKGKTTPERAFHTFRGDEPDLIVFGHSHIPYKSYIEGVLMFNPGSPTDKRGQPQFSLGILTIEDDCYDIQHVFF